MLGLKKELTLLSHSAAEEYYDALSSTPVSRACGEPAEGEWLRSSEEGSQAHKLALHRAAYDGDLEELRRLLPRLSMRQKLQLDAQGNTALHCAVLRHQHHAIEVLLDAGLPADSKNERQWNPIDEAVALQDAEATKLLYSQLLIDAKRAKKEKKAQLVSIMAQLPDFKLQLRWELGSQLFGLLLRRYAPDDTYFIYKVGKLLRVDGTLMGLDDRSHSFIPRWKRGRFTLLVNAGVSPTAAFLIDHTTRSYYDLYRERKAHLKGIDQEVAEMLAEGAGKVRVGEGEFVFRPVKTWLGRQATEKVEGWETEVYEASGSLTACTWIKVPVVVPPEATFHDYLAMQLPADDVAEVPADPLGAPLPDTQHQAPAPAAAPSGLAGSGSVHVGDAKRAGSSGRSVFGSGGGEAKAKKKKTQRFSSRCWLARRYPISLVEIIPLLETVAAGNRHFAQAAAYLRRFPEAEQRFPVRLQVPLVWTVFLQLAFRQFVLLGPNDQALQPGFFELPPGYHLDRFEEGDLLEKRAAPLLERIDSTPVT